MEGKNDRKQKNTSPKISYEPDSDVLIIESSTAPIDYAKEVGNVAIHFSRDNQPVLIEILETSKFFALLS